MTRIGWIRSDRGTVCRDGVQVIGKAVAVQPGKCHVRESKGLRIRPVIRNVCLQVLSHRLVIALHVSVLHQIELVHQAFVHGRIGVVPCVTHIAHPIG